MTVGNPESGEMCLCASRVAIISVPLRLKIILSRERGVYCRSKFGAILEEANRGVIKEQNALKVRIQQDGTASE
jgi:hypothetical protein